MASTISACSHFPSMKLECFSAEHSPEIYLFGFGCTGSSWLLKGFLFVAVSRFLTAVASLAVEHRL